MRSMLIGAVIAIEKKIKRIRDNDPVRSCDVYLEEDCAHVDGFLCDMKSCIILREYKKTKDTTSE